MMRAHVLALALLSAGAQAQEWRSDWSMTDTGFETVWQVANALDMSTTLDIALRCRADTGVREINWVLGECPTVKQVYSYFGMWGFVHASISYYMPRRRRRFWQLGTTVWSTGFVINNKSAGLNFRAVF